MEEPKIQDNSAHQVHSIAPVWDEKSSVLILGSFPSVKSREQAFFYGHPQNRFWRVTAFVLGKSVPKTTEEKKSFLLSSRIAVWDVICSCDIHGSADSSIKNVTANDISEILSKSNIKSIFVNGATAAKLYNKYILSKVGIEAVLLPSTSPANAAWSFERLCEKWAVLAEALNG